MSRFLSQYFINLTASAILLTTVLLTLCACDKNEDEQITYVRDGSIISTELVPEFIDIPFVLRFKDINKRSFEWQPATVYLDESFIGDYSAKRGTFAGLIPNPSVDGNYIIKVEGNNHYLRADAGVYTDMTHYNINGSLPDELLTWNDSSLYIIESDLTIPAGHTLEIKAGAVVLLGDHVSIHVMGEIQVAGTIYKPVYFTSFNQNTSWGEIKLENTTGDFDYVFFTNGGGDDSKAFGHSNSQPVIRASGSNLELTNCFFINNPGKAIGANNSTVRIDSSVISRCDTGGEYWSCHLEMSNSWVLDIPDASSEEIDDDNDGIYLNNVMADDSEGSSIYDCVFATGKDDGIDHNGAIVSVEGCIIEDYDNEGIAASNMNRVHVFNTLVKSCEQGIEAGYGSPEVFVNHCLLIDNETGLRFGDWYTWRNPEGTLTVKNSISCNNSNFNAWNWVSSTQQALDGALNITYSIVNDEFYNDSTGNIQGEVFLNENYLLELNSVGIEASDSGRDMGLLP